MKQAIISVLILSMLVFSMVDIISAEISNQAENYPFVIAPLERDALEVLDNELNSLENKTLCNIADVLEENGLLKNVTCAELPETEIDETEAKNILAEKIITYYDVAGNPVNDTIEENELKDAVLEVFLEKLPYTGSNYNDVKIRLTWKIGVGMKELPSETGFWYIYVDASTGEAVFIQQMFMTAGGGNPTISDAPQLGESETTDAESGKNLAYLYYAIPIAVILLTIILIIARRKK
ncbi:TPA: hypothetical protein HA246_04505 [Candidatus Woesearchaeota archaeon]|nr:hypothetical protein [Candidatus Woesearchaeota archaeon]